MARQPLAYEPDIKLQYYFTPTKNTKNERSKARIKNYNLPILQYMYNGDELDPLKCLISGSSGWVDYPCIVSKLPKTRFNIDFNHIRQEQTLNRSPGKSKDKKQKAPSSIFRGWKLDSHPRYLLEFMTIIPISREFHSYISQDSQVGSVVLTNYHKDIWPWFLKTASNFNKVCSRYSLDIKYKWFIDHLSDISYPSIHTRIKNL